GLPGLGFSYVNAGALSAGSCTPLSVPGQLPQIPGWLFDRLGPLHIRARYLPRALPWLVRFLRAADAKKIDAKADALRAMHRDVIAGYTAFLKGTAGMELFSVSGVLQAYTSSKRLDASLDWHLRGARGVRQELVGTDRLREMVPELSHEYVQGLLLADHGFVRQPHLFVTALVDRFASDGGDIVQARVHDLLREGDGTVVGVATTAGDISADRVVLCAGAWSMRLLAPYGVRIPLETQRGYHATALGANIQLSLPVVASEAKIYATPMQNGLRFAGTVEFAGLDAAADHRRFEAALELGRRMFPALECSGVEEWMGHRPCLPDSLPVVGPLAALRSLYVNFGHGHYGMTASPGSAALLAAMVSGRTLPFDPKPYSPERF
ncbi:MAG: FAD-dependent oxidoreductase, partial [Rhodospirillales bacterium]